MNRPRYIWLAFALCTLVVLAALAWVTSQMFEADRNRWQAEQIALREQNVRLALWRMDTKLTPLIAEETARPHYVYQSFLPASLQASDPFSQAQSSGPNFAPSPLLKQTGNVLLNFEADVAGNWRSPQTPEPQYESLALQNGLNPRTVDANRKRLNDLAAEIDPQQLIAQLPKQANPLDSTALAPPAADGPPSAKPAAPEGSESHSFDEPPVLPPGERAATPANDSVQLALPQTRQLKGGDYQQRGARYQQQAVQEFSKQRSNYVLPPTTSEMPITSVVESISRPLWMNGELLLARRIQRDGQTFVQGSWLDWPSLKQELLAEIADLFPGADLVPQENAELENPARMLAGLPVQLQLPLSKDIYFPSSALLWMVALSSTAVLLALGAVAGLLWGTLSLSERRAAFVSSVTHELRTPLTTFRMYAEMLASGMVPQAERRQEYLETLRVESERLSHLVENVLSYARLERGRGPTRDDSTTPAEILDRFEKRLADRAKLAEMELVAELDDGVATVPLTTDLGVVEQILFNLVDNSAKYAAHAEDRRIHLTAKTDAEGIVFSVRDYGPGYASASAAARAPAFQKSAQAAAETAPGVGLGLALCRRLAKQLGGKLQVRNHDRGGAEASLSLPAGS